jgi:hypothetical protein
MMMRLPLYLSLLCLPLVASYITLMRERGFQEEALWISPVTYNHTLIGPASASNARGSAFYFAQVCNVVRIANGI